MINMLRKGIKFSIQRVYCPQSYFESRHYGKRFNSIGKFKSLTFQLRAIYFHTFAVDMSVYNVYIIYMYIRYPDRMPQDKMPECEWCNKDTAKVQQGCYKSVTGV